MKIVVTGASGFVGRHLVPVLAHDAELLLVGRDAALLARLFPAFDCCGYDELGDRAQGADLLVHLASAHESQLNSLGSNATLLADTLASAQRAGVARFVDVRCARAFDGSNRSDAPRNVDGLSVTTIVLPAVYADRWTGKPAFLNNLPRPMAKSAFSVIASLNPTVHVSRLAAFLLNQPNPSDCEILSDGQDGNLVYRGIRRFCDLAISVALLVVFGWVLAIIWALVRLQSAGPGIFAQPRVGRDGELFTCYKFRTMQIGTPHDATHRVSSAHITALGRFLRKTKLDELPQLWNILRNEMSLIGPRPCLPTQHELIEARRRRSVLRMKPGISGLAQINEIDMSDPERLARWDHTYMALQSLLLDLRIGRATIFGKGQGDRVSH